MNVFEVESYVMLVITFVLLAIKIFALVNSLLYSAPSYVAAGKLTKPAWCAILGCAVLVQLIPLNLLIINLALTIAALVYLADVRPALAGLRRR